MALVRFEPWTLLSRLNEHVDRQFSPAADVEEYADRFELHIDLPGVVPGDVDITLEDGVLVLAGDRGIGRPAEQPVNFRRERGTGKFQRRFLLPETVDAERVTATGQNGVLTVTIPKLAKAQARKIPIAA
jgi:HSP20 family protein